MLDDPCKTCVHVVDSYRWSTINLQARRAKDGGRLAGCQLL